jgi:hypothetical protein
MPLRILPLKSHIFKKLKDRYQNGSKLSKNYHPCKEKIKVESTAKHTVNEKTVNVYSLKNN